MVVIVRYDLFIEFDNLECANDIKRQYNELWYTFADVASLPDNDISETRLPPEDQAMERSVVLSGVGMAPHETTITTLCRDLQGFQSLKIRAWIPVALRGCVY